MSCCCRFRHLVVYDVTHVGFVGSKSWMSGNASGFVAVAQYSFTAANNRELSFQAGQSLQLAPKGRLSYHFPVCFSYCLWNLCPCDQVLSNRATLPMMDQYAGCVRLLKF